MADPISNPFRGGHPVQRWFFRVAATNLFPHLEERPLRPLLAFSLAIVCCAFAAAGPQSAPQTIPIHDPVTPFLMFEGQAQQAMDFYTRVIPESEILDVARYGPGGPGPEGTVFIASMSLRGQTVLVSDSYISHDFTFTPSFSLFVTCEDQAEIERLTVALGEDGKTLMPLANYGFSQQFAWVEDRFGVSWQLNLP